MIASAARWRAPGGPTLTLASAGLAVVGITLGHAGALAVPTSQATPLVIFSHLFALGLAGGLLFLAAGVGFAVLDLLGVDGRVGPERWLFGVGLGLGIVAYAVLGLGFAGLLRPPFIAAALVLLAVVARQQLLGLLADLPVLLRGLLATRGALWRADRVLRLAIPLLDLLVLGLVILALMPPSGYDALMYHLMGPRRFLEAGRVLPLPDVQQANMPLTVDMLYLIGLAFGSAELSASMHLAMALLTAAATFAFGRRFVDERVAWIASIVFLSTSMVWLYGPNANVDYGLALFDFLAVFAVARWARDREPRWLVVAGVLGGLCLGTKYFGATTVGILGLFIVARAILARRRPVDVVCSALLYGLPVLLVASPWYVKNWLWLGTPVWPFLRSDPQDLNILLSANVKYGTSLLDSVLLPYHMYVDGSLEYAGSKPPLLLLVLPLYLLLPRRRAITALLALAAVQIAIWTQTAHVLRYLTPSMPELSIGAAYVVDRLGRRASLARLGRPLLSALVVAGLALTLVQSLVNARRAEPFAQLVGIESEQAFLVRAVPNHRMIAYLNDQGDAVRGVLMIGDRRAFYLEAPSWVDVSLGAFETLATAPSADDARAYLAQLGVSHVLVGERDLAWHAQYDPEGRVRAWWERFEATAGDYLVPEATLADYTLYRVRAPGETAAGQPSPVTLD